VKCSVCVCVPVRVQTLMNVPGQLEIVAHSTVCVMDLIHPGPTTVHVTRDLS